MQNVWAKRFASKTFGEMSNVNWPFSTKSRTKDLCILFGRKISNVNSGLKADLCTNVKTQALNPVTNSGDENFIEKV